MGWEQITKNPDWQNETPDTRKAVREDYFNRIVKPEVLKNNDDIEAVKKDFFGFTDKDVLGDDESKPMIPKRYIDAEGRLAEDQGDGKYKILEVKPPEEQSLGIMDFISGVNPFAGKKTQEEYREAAKQKRIENLSNIGSIEDTGQITSNFKPEREFLMERDKGVSEGGIEESWVSPVDFAPYGGLKAGSKIVKALTRKIGKKAAKEILSEGAEIALKSGELLETPAKTYTFMGKNFILDDPSAMRAMDIIEADEKAFQSLSKTSFKEKFIRNWIDASGNLKTQLLKTGEKGREAKEYLEGIFGASAKSKESIDEAYKLIYSDLDKKSQDVLDAVIRARRTTTIDSYKEGILHGGISSDDAARLLEKLPDDVAGVINKKADEYFSTMRERVLKPLRDNGLVSEEAYQKMLPLDYSERVWSTHFDPEIPGFDWRGRPIQVRHSGIQELDKGSKGALFNDSRILLADRIARVDKRIAWNEANKALASLADEIPENGIARHYKPKAKVSKNDVKIDYFVDGEKKQLVMPKKWAQEWLVSDPAIDQGFAKWMKIMSGSGPLKAMATGYNPTFAVRNIFRDFSHALLSTGQYSKWPIVGEAQLIKDYASVFSDTLGRKGIFQELIKNGGGRELLTHQGIAKGKVARYIQKHPSLSKALNYLSWINETSEIFTRLAVMRRAKINGASSREAANIAANLIDFSQGGRYAKVIDKAVPYFNAGIQGSRTLLRAAKRNPVNFAGRLASLAGIAIPLTLNNYFRHAELMEQIPSGVAAGNFIIPLGTHEMDKNGEKRHHYIPIPKDQGQRVFASIFENIARGMAGKTINMQEIKLAAKEFAPFGLDTLPPSLKAILGYAYNTDFFKEEPIWKSEKVSPSQEYRYDTSDALKKLGEITADTPVEMSPERTKYALQQFFTYGNVYTDIFDSFAGALVGETPEWLKLETAEAAKTKMPFLREIFRKGTPYQKYYDIINTTEEKYTTKRVKEKNKLNDLLRQYSDMPHEKTRLNMNEYLEKLPQDLRQGASRKIKEFERTKSIEHGYMIKRMITMSPEARAEIYTELMKTFSEDMKNKFIENSRKFKGFWSPEFRRSIKNLETIHEK